MRLDLHIHSRYSFDCLSHPTDILMTARRKELTGIAVTDHNTIKGALEASRLNEDDELTIIIGAEYTTDSGDIIGLFLNEEMPATKNPLEMIDRIRAQGGLVVLPHPFKGHRLDDELLGRVDAIEGFNARVSDESNAKARELAKRHGKPLVAGSDAHTCREIGNAVMIFEAPSIRTGVLSGSPTFASRRSPIAATLFSQTIGVMKRGRYAEAPRALGGAIGKMRRER